MSVVLKALIVVAYITSACLGATVSYDFTIKREKKSPDGFQKDVMIVNGQFPGPLIEANLGDTIQVTVNNAITGPAEGTTIHWHGFLQSGTQFMDGVPGVSQCPIAPGKSFTYTFVASSAGTTWWHSHYSAQYSGGAYGPIIIHPPGESGFDIDKGAIVLNDWFHQDYLSVVDFVTSPAPLGPPPIPFSDNNLINGQMNTDCLLPGGGATCKTHSGIDTFRMSPGKKHLFRLINAGSEGVQKFSLDGHTLTVVQNDFTPVVPYQTNVVTLAVGQRAHVIVEGLANGTGSYWMRSVIPGNTGACSFANQPTALAVLYYLHDDLNTFTNSTPWVDTTTQCENDPLSQTVPLQPITPPSNPATTQLLTIGVAPNATGNWVWTVNGQTFRVNYNFPVLELANKGNTSYPFDPEWNVYNFGSNSSIRIHLENASPAAHPMHLHGHNMYILSAGAGPWDGTIVNPSNPQRRDTQLVPPFGHLVFQIDADNPGVWPFHCHIAWHVSAGLYISVLERPDDIANIAIPGALAQGCADWNAFTSSNIPDQIDSGEKARA